MHHVGLQFPLLLLLLSLSHSLDTSSCESLVVVESIPDDLTYPKSSVSTLSTTDAMLFMLENAESSLDLAEYYFNMRPNPPPGDESDSNGRLVWQGLLDTGKKLKAARGNLRIVRNFPDPSKPFEFHDTTDTADLAEAGAADVRYLDFEKLIGGGIMHTKLWVADGVHFYLGSANMSWRSLRQIKELGILGVNCPIIGQDLQKLFEIYWYLTTNPVPDKFPTQFDTQYNSQNPMNFQIESDSSKMTSYLMSSPPQFSTEHRTIEIDGLLQVLNSAEEFIHIEIGNYFPAIEHTYPNKYWPVIDNALRHAVFDRGVELRLLIGLFLHSLPRSDEYNYLNSLAALNGSGSRGNVIKSEVKLFIIPSYTPVQAKLRYARGNHAKFVVTEKHSYVSTSNLSGDYFTSTSGISLIMENTGSCGVCDTLDKVFDRDWSSEYTKPLRPWGAGSLEEEEDRGDQRMELFQYYRKSICFCVVLAALSLCSIYIVCYTQYTSSVRAVAWCFRLGGRRAKRAIHK